MKASSKVFPTFLILVLGPLLAVTAAIPQAAPAGPEGDAFLQANTKYNHGDLAGDKAAAAEDFRRCQDTGVTNFVEYKIARAEAQALAP